MKPQNEIRLTWIVIGVICSGATLLLYFLNPYVAILPPVLLFLIIIVNMKAFGIPFKTFVFGIESNKNTKVTKGISND